MKTVVYICPLQSCFFNLTLAVVFVFGVDSAVGEGHSDDGVGLQAFGHQNEWR